MSVRVLLVDDRADLRLMMRVWLEDQGCTFSEASSGEEALERVGAGEFDVVVLDYMMPPGMTGLDVARRLRESGEGVPIILCSAYLSPDIRAEALSLHVEPIDKANLDELVRRVRALGTGDG